MTLDDVKKYLRVETTDDDALITSLITATTAYVERKSGKAYKSDDEVWNLLIKMLVAHWYENRGAEVTGTITSKIAHTVDVLIDHISVCSDYTLKVIA